MFSDNVLDGEVGYTVNSSEQTVGQIEVIQVLVLSEVPKLNKSVTKEKEITRSNPVSPEKKLYKKKNGFI